MTSANRPPNLPATLPAPKADPDAPTPPEVISFLAFREAMDAMLALAGTGPMAVFNEGLTVTADRVAFISATPVPGVEPVVVGADSESPEWGWPVSIKVEEMP